jgi:5-methylcytosine-specific restriction protein A
MRNGSTRRWRQLRAEVLTHNRTCYLCGAPATQVDHVIPVKVAPHLQYERTNLAPVCWPCNRRKAARPLAEVRPARRSPRWTR